MSSEKRVAVYVRVSTTGKKGERCQDTAMQLRDIKSYLLTLGIEDFDLYEDKGHSGTKASRPALNKMILACSVGRVSHVVCWKMDRLFRSLQHLVNTLSDFENLHIKFIAIKDGIDLTTSSGRLMMQIVGAFAEFEAAVIKERVNAGLENARAKGIKLGRPFAKGAHSVKKLKTQGMSVKEISAMLEMPIRTVYNNLKGEPISQN